MKGKAIIPLVLGLCIGLVAVKFVVDTLKKAKASGAAQRTFSAVRAKQDIGAFARITPEMIEVVEASDAKFAPAGDRIGGMDELKDRVTCKAIPQYSPVLRSMLAPPGTPHGMEGRIKPGFRAVSVKIDEVSGVAYQIQPGDLVDVIVVMDIESSGRGKKKETIAEVILQKIEVAAIGQSTTTAPEDASAKVKPAKSATLLVAESDVPKLHLAGTRGKITLSLRGKDDEIAPLTAAAHSNDLFRAFRSLLNPDADEGPAAAHGASQPSGVEQTLVKAQEPEPPYGVTVYRRSTVANAAVNVERITFENVRSAKIIDVADSPVRGVANMMRGGTNRPVPLPTRKGTTVTPPVSREEDSAVPIRQPADMDDEEQGG